MFPPADDSPRLVDTNVLSLFFKEHDQKSRLRAQLYEPDLVGHILAISFVTKGELYLWTLVRKWGSQRVSRMEEKLSNLVTLPWHDAVAHRYARIQHQSPKKSNDAWIAACALAYGCTLVTDDSDFAGIADLQIISHHDEGRR